MTGVIIFFDACIDAAPAADAPGEVKAISPQGIREGFLGADFEFLPVFLYVSPLQFGNNLFLLLRCHLPEMFLQEVFGFLFRAGGAKRKREGRQSGYRSISNELSSGKALIFHSLIPRAGPSGGGSGFIGLNLGSWGSWQLAKRK